ncbi:MAG: terpene cyclase/mutase family protein [Planctomycetales bacterium]|nr:terpene cyclase/mutase family protein [Planctomycetales bacterium]
MDASSKPGGGATDPPAPPGKGSAAGAEPSALGEAFEEVVRASPSWLFSLMLHMLVVIVLAFWTLPQLPSITKEFLLADPADEDTLDDFQEIDILPVDLDTDPVELEVQPETEVLAEEVELSPFEDLSATQGFTELSELALTPSGVTAPTDAVGYQGEGTTGRGRMSRTAIAKAGGNRASEEAIENALRWLVEHQNNDGTWSLAHNVGRCNGRCPNPSPASPAESLRAGTGLALLPFLGAGQTHKQGKYKRTVERGLRALVDLGKAGELGLDWRDPGGAGSYSHGICAIALTEAYGMTGDASLGGAAQAAVEHIAACQGDDGGWRYRPKDAPGDTSVVGWQIMALKSGHLAGLSIPPATVAGASKFLDAAARSDGAEYVYVPTEDAVSPTRSAIGLLCRMYLGWKKDNEALRRGAEKLAKQGPSADNYYHNYYAAQVLFQYTGGRGPVWREWNSKMRDQLIAQQDTQGHARGSWYVESPGAHSDRGGRLYMTSLATMTLEVYYRYLPIFDTGAVERDFPQ